MKINSKNLLIWFFIVYSFAIVYLFYINIFNKFECDICKSCEPGTESCETYIYVVTPTHSRLTQKAELTRLVHTFKLVECLHWIVVEDSVEKSTLVANLLAKSNLITTHLFIQTPPHQKLKKEDPRWKKARGVLQRNEGLKWIRSNNITSGVIYFADDDNTYDLELFKEMRLTEKVSVWPVGLVGKLKYESPILNHLGKVVAWRTKWKTHRTFATDMAGFAVNADFFSQSKATFSSDSYIGELENDFLSQFASLDDLEARADNCSKILVWHTQSMEPSLKNEVHYDNGQHNMNIEI